MHLSCGRAENSVQHPAAGTMSPIAGNREPASRATRTALATTPLARLAQVDDKFTHWMFCAKGPEQLREKLTFDAQKDGFTSAPSPVDTPHGPS
jgi:hypothetical protein